MCAENEIEIIFRHFAGCNTGNSIFFLHQNDKAGGRFCGDFSSNFTVKEGGEPEERP